MKSMGPIKLLTERFLPWSDVLGKFELFLFPDLPELHQFLFQIKLCRRPRTDGIDLKAVLTQIVGEEFPDVILAPRLVELPQC